MKTILIINQHGDNRGDEAALSAMVEELGKKVEARFVLFHQFRDRSLPVNLSHPATRYSIILSLRQAAGMLLYSLFRLVGLHVTFFLDRTCREMVQAFRDADLVISAPGGPYFGDLYKNHELVHWFFVWLGVQNGKKLFLYAPSAGPFRNLLLNPIRRYFFKKFDTVCLREEVSAKNLAGLMGQDFPIHITADSALQKEIDPRGGASLIKIPADVKDPFLVAITAIDYRYPGASKAEKKVLRDHYLDIMEAVGEFLCERKSVHFVFLPQLYGKFHSDRAIQEHVAKALPQGASWEIVAPELNSEQHQKIVANADMCIACRYHPQIFAASAHVPALCIYYEHKTLGFLKAMGITEYGHDIWSLDKPKVLASLEQLLANREGIRERLQKAMPSLREKARTTTRLAVELLEDPR